MAATHQGPDPTITLSEGKPTDLDTVKDQPLSVNTELSSSPDASRDAVALGHSRDNSGQAALFGSGGDSSIPSNVYAPQPQTFYYRGYDNVAGPWDEYSQFVNPEALEIGSPGIYNENPSLMFHTGYGYSPQMPYGPYSPVTTPLTSVGVGGDPQLYSNQQFPFSGPPYYQQVGPSMPFITSPTPVSQPDLTSLVNVDRQSEGMLFEPRPGYPPQLGSFGRGNFPGNSGTLGFHDLPQGYDGYSSIGLWSDWSKPSDRQRPMTPSSPAVFPQPVGPNGSFGQNASHHQRSYGFGNSSDPYSRNYLQKGFNPGSSFGNAMVSSLGMNGRSWLALDNSRRYGRGTSSLCSCNGTLDLLNEQNRGPRASKPKIQNATDDSTSLDTGKYNTSSVKAHNELYNGADFVTEYEDAKFFVIKSYTEDNVHKSIKYGVWASTPNGNKKLDAAYNEAKENSGTCPIFLLFSVNASAQFCGVAEMIGPVDFDRSVDYWQQDKWSGQFPVKWHVIKDVPNNQFRHILLENNDNKPVTNSRDTQEVKLEQGIEMLKIFKSYETEMSILDDFEFYEDRQKTMQERKARQQASLATTGANENRETPAISSGFIKQMSKSFAQVVRLDDNKEGATVETPGSGPDPTATGQTT